MAEAKMETTPSKVGTPWMALGETAVLTVFCIIDLRYMCRYTWKRNTIQYNTIPYHTIQCNTIHILNLWYPSLVWVKFACHSAVQVSTGAVNSLTCCLLLLQCTVDRIPKPADLWMKLATDSYSIDFTGLFFLKWRLNCWTIKAFRTLHNKRIPWNQGAVPTLPVASATSTLASGHPLPQELWHQKGQRRKDKSRDSHDNDCHI